MTASKQSRLTEQQREYLVALGLSRDCVDLYEVLLGQGHLTAQQAAGYTRNFVSAQYRLFYRLEALGLARQAGGRPREFQGVPLETGLPASLVLKKSELENLLAKSLSEAKADSSTVRLLVGKQALYSEYARLAAGAQHTVDIFAIGIAYSPELVAVQKAAVKRGVSIRHIVQQIKPSNYHVVHTWQRLGVQLRLASQERGFHLMLFDAKLAIISFSDPDNTEDRLSIVTDSASALRLFTAQFQVLWQEAAEIKI